MKKTTTKIITFTLDDALIKIYKKSCAKLGIKLSTRLNILIKKDLRYLNMLILEEQTDTDINKAKHITLDKFK